VHFCRWGYRTLGVVADVVEKYKAAGIPLEAIWTDIDYMVRMSTHHIYDCITLRTPLISKHILEAYTVCHH
jgi:alpha-glucosidase (family GH31 glycosyl hydrolase)